MRLLSLTLALGLVSVALAAGGGQGSPDAGKQPGLSAVAGAPFVPSDFSRGATVDNRWNPLRPGMQYVFEGMSKDGKKRMIFTVTDLVKVVGGVRNVVVWDRDYTDGELVEAELAFFAQDNAGNVWHTGEYPEEYEGGKVVDAPAWIVGVRGAKAGFEMKASPRLGMPPYPQGYAPPPVNWTDHAEIYKVDQRVCVPLRCYDHVLITKEYNPDEPGRWQTKYYAPGVGNIKVGWLGKDPDKEATALVKLVHLDPAALAQVRRAALAFDKRAYKTRPKVYGVTRPAEQR